MFSSVFNKCMLKLRYFPMFSVYESSRTLSLVVFLTAFKYICTCEGLEGDTS